MSILADHQIIDLCHPNIESPSALAGFADYCKHYHIRGVPNAPLTYEEWFERHYDQSFKPMITPFVAESIRAKSILLDGDLDNPQMLSRKVISFGTTSFGYDVRLAEDIKLFTNANGAIIDPKKFDEACLVQAKIHTDEDGARYAILPPNSYLLGHTPEIFDIPRDVMVICVGKSTYARAGVIINTTPIEPGFEGQIVLEASNSTSLPVKIYVDEGIAQFLFFKGDMECKTSYADRGGKYMHQRSVVFSKV